MSNRRMVAQIETAAEQAVPSARSDRLGGWSAHYGAGQVRRINSVATHGDDPGREQTTARLRRIADLYRSNDLNPMIRQTSLDAWLEPHLAGWAISGDTLVMTATPARHPVTETITDGQWMSWVEARSSSATRAHEAFASLGRLDHPHTTNAVSAGGNTTALGRAVLVGDLVGLFDIQTDPAFRRRGLGRRVTQSLIGWAFEREAVGVYLQVSAVNRPALELYESLGFVRQYSYRYRTLVSHPTGAAGSWSHPADRARRTD